METKSGERYGDPASFVFKGQCFELGRSSDAKPCAICERPIRRCYMIHAPSSSSKFLIGSECFRLFKDLDLFKKLQAAAIWLQTTIEAEERDTRTYQPRAEVSDRMAAWRKLKQEALRKIRDYRKATGKEWLPENLYELNEAATRMPVTYKRANAAVKWYDQQILILETKISSIK